MKFIERIERCWSRYALTSMARVLTVGLLFSLAPYAQAAVETYQEGVSSYIGTQDTYLEENSPGTPQGTDTVVKVENSGGSRQQGLIRFDNIFGGGAGQIHLGSIINSATLTVNVSNTSSGGAVIRLHRMKVTWPETATWNSMSSGIQTDDAEAMSAHDAQVADPTNSGTEVITGLAAALQAWSDGATNHGWAILSSSSDGWDFSSSEFGTAASRPLLTVDWTPGICPGGNVTTTTDSTDNSSLRACVIWSNANSGTDTITLPAGTYTPTIAGAGEDAAATGDLDITDDVIINGNTAGATIVDGNSLDRVFEILGADVTMTNLTILDSDVTADGAGLALDATASLTITHSTVSGNTTTTDGGGIATSGGAVDLTNVTLSPHIS